MDPTIPPRRRPRLGRARRRVASFLWPSALTSTLGWLRSRRSMPPKPFDLTARHALVTGAGARTGSASRAPGCSPGSARESRSPRRRSGSTSARRSLEARRSRSSPTSPTARRPPPWPRRAGGARRDRHRRQRGGDGADRRRRGRGTVRRAVAGRARPPARDHAEDRVQCDAGGPAGDGRAPAWADRDGLLGHRTAGDGARIDGIRDRQGRDERA